MTEFPITEQWTDKKGRTWIYEYHDCDDFSVLPKEQCSQCYGVCFVGEQMVIGYSVKKDAWSLIGGTIESGETFLETLAREVQEESNMRVLSAKPIGYQKVMNDPRGLFYQLRFAVRVEPISEFVSDPTGTVTAIKLIDPRDHKEYFNWNRIGDIIIEKALRLKNSL